MKIDDRPVAPQAATLAVRHRLLAAGRAVGAEHNDSAAESLLGANGDIHRPSRQDNSGDLPRLSRVPVVDRGVPARPLRFVERLVVDDVVCLLPAEP